MKARVGWLAAAVCLATLTACSSKDEGHDPTPAAPSIGITASSTSVVANGTNTVTISVSDSGGGPITVTTTRGTFTVSGTSSATIAGAAGTLTLVTCNAQTSTTCAGTATVTATSASGTDSVNVTFGALATVCPANCAADTGCAGFTCTLSGGGSGTCSATTPSACVAGPACTPNPAGATTETSCSDGIDNDCAGGIDCADTACDGQPCKSGSPSFVCQAGACTDITSGLALTVAPLRTRLPANGTTSTSVVVAVTKNGAAATGLQVTLATDLGTLAPTAAVATGADGKATFTFTASATAGTATLTATLVSVPTFQQTATITMPRLGSLQIPENPGAAQFAVMGAKTSGWNEYGWLQVQALDDQGQPYPDGLDVVFEHQQLGGSTLGVPVATTCATLAAPCVAYTGAISSAGNTTETGLAKAWLYSGTLAGTLAVTATATADGVTRTVNLPTVAVVGAKASGTNFSVVCSPRNVPALAETDCAISRVDAPFTCEAILKDRFGNVLGRSTQVIFESEAASVGHVVTTPQYDPKAGSGDGLGTALQIFNTLGNGLPFDVPIQPGEPSVDLGAPDVCGSQVHNPRDGVVTIVAVADGEEAFFDANGNGVYDAGEPFVDQGEPFVDINDNGVWDDGSVAGTVREPFLDVDGNGDYTPGNGVWDANTKIWTQTVVVYTGVPDTMVASATPTYLGTRWVGPAFTDACTATPAAPAFSVDAEVTGPPLIPATSQTYHVVASDTNLNELDTGTAYEVTSIDGVVKLEYLGLPSYVDDLGFFYRYWPCDQGGACASQCRATGANLPCVMKPAVLDFGCGISAPVIVTGGSKPGADRLDWNVTTPYTADLGTSHSVIVRRSLSGTVN